jgi:hypothetical protein
MDHNATSDTCSKNDPEDNRIALPRTIAGLRKRKAIRIVG